jgi:hypothetical protein
LLNHNWEILVRATSAASENHPDTLYLVKTFYGEEPKDTFSVYKIENPGAGQPSYTIDYDPLNHQSPHCSPYPGNTNTIPIRKVYPLHNAIRICSDYGDDDIRKNLISKQSQYEELPKDTSYDEYPYERQQCSGVLVASGLPTANDAIQNVRMFQKLDTDSEYYIDIVEFM